MRGSRAEAANAAALGGKAPGLTLGWGSMAARKMACTHPGCLSAGLNDINKCVQHYSLVSQVIIRSVSVTWQLAEQIVMALH